MCSSDLKDCLVYEHSGVASLDAQTCTKILQRAKYKPARDAAGKPVKSTHVLYFRWWAG